MAMTLKALRVNNRMTQVEAADKLKISVDTLSNWENGKTFPDVMQIKKIEELYSVSYQDIIFLPQ